MKKKLNPRNLQLSDNARIGYTYFVMRTVDGGYRWLLADRNGETLCSSEPIAQKSECLKRLRAVQRHATTKHVIDET